MKLIIQIPAYNEAGLIQTTVGALPTFVDGFDDVEYLLIDDGSSDDTAALAKNSGVHHILKLGSNLGLAKAFMAGIERSLLLGADVIVNTDADNQYCADDIPKLVRPILDCKSQIVVGARPIQKIEEFSAIKKGLQRLGSWVVRQASGAEIVDAPSGFRAYSREAAAQLYVVNTYTYTIETIIQAGRKRIPMLSVPVKVNVVTRPSRLFSSIGEYVFRSTVTILRIFVLYKPLKFFFAIGLLICIPALIVIARFVFYYSNGYGDGHVQSLVLSGGLLGVGSMMFAVGILADLIAANRCLLEDIRARNLLSVSNVQQPDRYDNSSNVISLDLVQAAR